MNNTIQLIVIAIIPVLFAIILHEVSHGYVAHLFGDDTAKNPQDISDWKRGLPSKILKLYL